MKQLTWALIGLIVCGLCGCGDTAVSPDGQTAPADAGGDARPILSEATAAICDDGQDNDHDGFVDCADQDCWPLATCARARDSGTSDSGEPGDAGSTSKDGGGGLDASDLGSADGPCVPQSFTLALVGPSGGSACSFPFSKPYTPGLINLLLTPGWGTVCYAGSPQNCGSGPSGDGWWFSGDEIALCDATCSRFYAQTTAGKLTVRIGCPTEHCAH